jgi:hypothetical protein
LADPEKEAEPNLPSVRLRSQGRRDISSVEEKRRFLKTGTWQRLSVTGVHQGVREIMKETGKIRLTAEVPRALIHSYTTTSQLNRVCGRSTPRPLLLPSDTSPQNGNGCSIGSDVPGVTMGYTSRHGREGTPRLAQMSILLYLNLSSYAVPGVTRGVGREE